MMEMVIAEFASIPEAMGVARQLHTSGCQVQWAFRDPPAGPGGRRPGWHRAMSGIFGTLGVGAATWWLLQARSGRRRWPVALAAMTGVGLGVGTGVVGPWLQSRRGERVVLAAHVDSAAGAEVATHLRTLGGRRVRRRKG